MFDRIRRPIAFICRFGEAAVAISMALSMTRRRPTAASNHRWRSIGAVLFVSAILLGAGWLSRRTQPGPPTIARAAILDQLQLTSANPDFVERATTLLQGAGYAVDYFPGEAVTVELYRRLPQQGYSLIILRVHAARREEHGVQTDEAVLFTSDRIDPLLYNVSGIQPAAATAVALDRAATAATAAAAGMTIDSSLPVRPDEVSHISPVFYDPGSGELPFFGLRPSFFEFDLEGRFDEAPSVILMGCDGLRSDALASAFVGRGAKEFVSWDQPVSAAHTDASTLDLLRRAVVDGEPMSEAVRRTMEDLGPDPTFGGELVSFPRIGPNLP